MGRRKSSKSGGASTHLLRKEKAAMAKKANNKEEDSNSESEESGNFIAFDNNNNRNDSDDNEEEIFNLDIGDDEEDDNEDEDSDASSDDDDDEDDMDDEDNDLNNLVSNLPDDIRNKILRKKKIDNSGIVSEESDSDDGSEGGTDWGKKKQVYWTGDTADLEIGQEVEDAEDEEAAAQELYESKVKRMKASDFFDDVNNSDNNSGSNDSSSSDEEEENMGQILQRSGNDKSSNRNLTKKLSSISNKKSNDMAMGDLELAALNSNSMESTVEVEKLSKDISKLTKQQKLDLLNRNSPELLGIVAELKDLISDLQKRVLPLKEFLTKIVTEYNYAIEDDIVEYTEVKYQLLMSYCTNVLFYLYMKAQGKSVQSHPVMKQMLKLRFVMEKMRPIDAKLRHQIDRLLQYSRMDTEELDKQKSNTGLFLRPNPSAMLIDNNDGDNNDKNDSSESEGSEEMSDSNNDTALYKAPKRTAVPYKENETAEEKKAERLEKQRNKLRRSELMQTLREEFGTAPEEAASSGLGLKSGDLLKLQEEEEERINFEEDRFVRTTLSRKEKKSIKRRTAAATRLDNFDDIGDTIVGDLEEISRLAESHSAPSVPDHDNDSYDSDTNEQNGNNTTVALQKAVNALIQPEGLSKAGRKNRASLMEENLRSHETKERKRRRAPMGYDEGAVDSNDDSDPNMFDNLLEDFSSKKKSFLKQKKDHYTAEPRYGGVDVSIDDGDKRAATYEIMKNRGLTPHRKKSNRNPRVKKREMYDKAVIRRKGQVRDVITGAAGAYGGELTGIKSNIARSRKIGV